MAAGNMDSAFSTRNRKCRRKNMAEIANANANAAICEEEDMFHNKLPESLITHILSFLPTKDAVGTCLLSKRWKYRWTFLTKLSLHDDDVSSFSHQYQRKNIRRNFINFVTKALILTRALFIETLSLSFSTQYDASLLDEWLCSIFNHVTLKNLRIHSHFKLPFSHRASDFFSKFPRLLLEELELLTNSISLIKVPFPPNVQAIHFTNLKLLKLCGIDFKAHMNYYSTNIWLIFPLLTKFEAKNCSWFGTNASLVFLHAPLLQSISIEHDDAPLLSPPPSSLIVFDSSLLLKEFTYCGYYIPQSICIRFQCYASVNITLHDGPNLRRMSSFFIFQLLSQFSHAKCIKFEVAKVLEQPEEELCVFPMLTHLELSLVSVDILLALLHKSTALKTLVLKGIRKFAKEHLDIAVLPNCLETLHVVKFEEVSGDEHELVLAKFLIQNCKMLEKMNFSLDSQSSVKSLDKYKVMEEFKEKLYSFSNFFSVIVEFSS